MRNGKRLGITNALICNKPDSIAQTLKYQLKKQSRKSHRRFDRLAVTVHLQFTILFYLHFGIGIGIW